MEKGEVDKLDSKQLVGGMWDNEWKERERKMSGKRKERVFIGNEGKADREEHRMNRKKICWRNKRKVWREIRERRRKS